MAEEEIEEEDQIEEVSEDILLEEEDVETEAGSPIGLIPKLLNNKKAIIILASIIGVLILGTILYSFKEKPEKKADKSNDSKIEKIQEKNDEKKPSQKDETTSKKRKKKIKYTKLFNQLSADATADILKELSYENISFLQEQNGKNYSISVDRDEIDRARNVLARKRLPEPGNKGYELLDNAATLGVTQFDKRIRFLRALSGELEKAIEQFDMIESAKIQIVLPEQRLFSVAQPPVTASVLIRKKQARSLTDQIVFSIIQLVASAVENLQPINVSVIDTEGIVLSEGIFERLAQQKEKKKEVVKKEAVVKKSEVVELKAEPIKPNVEKMTKWFDFKKEYDLKLKNKITTQLNGVLPPNAFKVAVNSQIAFLDQKDKNLDIKRLSISILVDALNDEIYLDADIKQEIFRTVASASGYIKGRDIIQLTKGDYFSQELVETEKKLKTKEILTWILGLLLVSIVGLGYRFIKRKKEDKTSKDEPSLDFDKIAEDEEENSEDQLKTMASQNPELVAKLLEKWLEENPEKEIQEEVV